MVVKDVYMMLRTNSIFARLQNDCVMVRKVNKAFDYKMWVSNTVDNYLTKEDKFDFINIIKRK